MEEKEEDTDVDKDPAEKRGSLMHLMSRKTLSQALLNYEIKQELKENNLTKEVKFGPLESCGRKKNYKETRTDFFKKRDDERKNKLYSHVCYKGCKMRGCQRISSFDGLWKINHAICMWDNRTAYPDTLIKFVPQVCTNEPEFGSGFCSTHARAVERQGRPSKLRPFLKSCGTDGIKVNKEEKNKIEAKLKEIAEQDSKGGKSQGQTAGKEQGTEYMLRNKKLMNIENMTVDEVEECRKDVGHNVKLRRYTRGLLAACSGGGHIWSFDTRLLGKKGQNSIFHHNCCGYTKALAKEPKQDPKGLDEKMLSLKFFGSIKIFISKNVFWSTKTFGSA